MVNDSQTAMNCPQLVYPTGYPQSIHRFPQRSGPRRLRIFRPGPAFQGKWRNSAEEWRQRGLHPVNGDELCKFLRVFQGGILDMLFQHIWKMISELLLYWIYTNSSNQFKPRVFFLPETRRGCCGPSQNLEMNGPGTKKMIGIWSDMALSGNRWHMMPIINPYKYCVWSVNDVWSSFYQSDPIRRYDGDATQNWRWFVGSATATVWFLDSSWIQSSHRSEDLGHKNWIMRGGVVEE